MQNTIIYSSPRQVVTTPRRELVEIELSEEDLPQNDELSIQIATITLRNKDKAARFFVRLVMEDGRPVAILQACDLQRDSHPEKELRGKWFERLERSIRADDSRPKIEA